jgi:Holliday junction resolvase RusA-like endonuclease
MAEEKETQNNQSEKAQKIGLICRGTIQGQMPRKSNSRRIVRINNRPKNIKSADAINWMTSAVLQIQVALREYAVDAPYTLPVALYADIYYRSGRSDLSSELLMDSLERAGLIKNDRQIKHQSISGYVDRHEPRVDWALAPLSVAESNRFFGYNALE